MKFHKTRVVYGKECGLLKSRNIIATITYVEVPLNKIKANLKIHITHVAVLKKLLPKSWSFIPKLCFKGVRGPSRNHVASLGGGGQPKGHERLRGGRGSLPKGHVTKMIENLSKFPLLRDTLD